MKRKFSIRIMVPLTVGLVLIAASIFHFSRDSESGKAGRETKVLTTDREADQSSDQVYKGQRSGKGKLQGSSLTPEKAATLVADFNAKTRDINQRALFSSDLIIKLCKNGYAREAFDLIEKDYGRVRSNQLVNFFTHADLPREELLSMIPNMDFKADAETCLRGFTLRYRPEELGDVLTSPEVGSLMSSLGDRFPPQAMSSLVANSLNSALLDGSSDPGKIVDTGLHLNSEGLLDAAQLLNLISKVPGGAFEKWNMILGVDPKTSWTGDSRNKRNGVIAEMVLSDGPQALSKILESSGNHRADDLRKAIGSWNEADPSAAANWYSQNRSGLNPDDQGAVASTFAREAMISSEFEGARQWAELINDPKLRAETLKAIEGRIAASKTVEQPTN
jgi:hypothetical protein